MRFLFSFFSPPHRFYVSLPPRRKDEDTQRSNFNRKIVNRKIVNINYDSFFQNPIQERDCRRDVTMQLTPGRQRQTLLAFWRSHHRK